MTINSTHKLALVTLVLKKFTADNKAARAAGNHEEAVRTAKIARQLRKVYYQLGGK